MGNSNRIDFEGVSGFPHSSSPHSSILSIYVHPLLGAPIFSCPYRGLVKRSGLSCSKQSIGSPCNCGSIQTTRYGKTTCLLGVSMYRKLCEILSVYKNKIGSFKEAAWDCKNFSGLLLVSPTFAPGGTCLSSSLLGVLEEKYDKYSLPSSLTFQSSSFHS